MNILARKLNNNTMSEELCSNKGLLYLTLVIVFCLSCLMVISSCYVGIEATYT